MKQIIFIIAFSLIGNAIFSQTDKFNKLLNLNGNTIGITSILQKDTSYIIAGGNNCGIGVYLLNSYADTVWLKCYYDSLIDYLGAVPNNFKKTTDGNYIAAGTAQNGIATNNRFFLLKLDSNFNKIYMKAMLNDTACDGCLQGNYAFENNNHDYILLGASSRDSSGVLNTGGFEDGLLLKTDTGGSIINHKLYSGTYNNHNWLNTGLQMGNNYYLFGGTYSYAPAYVTGFDRTDGWVVKTDMQGNEITSVTFGNPMLSDGEFTTCYPLQGNKIITATTYAYDSVCITWTTAYGDTECLTLIPLSKPCLLVYNENLQIEKEIYFNTTHLIEGPITSPSPNLYNKYDTLYGKGIQHFCINSKNEYALLGTDIKTIVGSGDLFYMNAYVTVLDANFKVLFTRYFNPPGVSFDSGDQTVPNVITSTSDGGYIFGGYVVDNTLTPSQQSWLVKTDSLGCDGLHSCNDTALTIQILQSPDTICLKDTAWLHLKFKGRSAPYFIYANNTLVLDSIYYPYTLPLWIDTLMPYIPQDSGMQQIIVKVKDPWGWQQSDTVQTFVKNCHSGFASEEFYKYKIEIYPNPAHTFVNIKITGIDNSEDLELRFCDIKGSTINVYKYLSRNIKIDLKNQKPGVYYLILKNKSAVICSRKLIIE